MAESAWLLDTSILIDVLRGVKSARAWIDSLPESNCAISVVTAAELLAGCRNRSEQRAVERELALYSMAWLDEETSRAALELYRSFHLSHGVGFLDCLVGATALTRGYRLATLNVKHFVPFADLQVAQPY